MVENMGHSDFFHKHSKSDISLSQRKKEGTKDTERSVVYV